MVLVLSRGILRDVENATPKPHPLKKHHRAIKTGFKIKGLECLLVLWEKVRAAVILGKAKQFCAQLTAGMAITAAKKRKKISRLNLESTETLYLGCGRNSSNTLRREKNLKISGGRAHNRGMSSKLFKKSNILKVTSLMHCNLLYDFFFPPSLTHILVWAL